MLKHEEILKLDWQLLTAHTIIANTAFLKTILNNQTLIRAKLENRPIAEIAAEIDEFYDKNLKLVEDVIRKGIPEYPKIEKE